MIETTQSLSEIEVYLVCRVFPGSPGSMLLWDTVSQGLRPHRRLGKQSCEYPHGAPVSSRAVMEGKLCFSVSMKEANGPYPGADFAGTQISIPILMGGAT